jgi:hypothetical protein
MFSGLSRGSILHGVDRANGMRWFTGSIERVTPSMGYSNIVGQFPSVDLDIVANIDGKQRVFKGIHSNDSIADFGEDSIILADNKDSLYNYVKSLLKISEDATDKENIRKHEAWKPQYRSILAEMMPGVSNSNEVKELKEQVGNFQSQLAEVLALLKSGNFKKE